MFSLRRKTRPTPKPVNASTVALGLRTFAADLEISGDLDAVDLAGPMPMGLDDWAEYPDNPYRLVCFPHLRGQSSESPAA